MAVTEQTVESDSAKVDVDLSIGTRLGGVTVGGAAAGLVVIVAALARLCALGNRPLGAAEAERALLSLRFVQGQPTELTSISPLLANLNVLVFFLTGASDFWVRLAPALFGIVLVALPALCFRHRLSTGGALAASALIAVSPTFMLFSRSVAPAMLSTVTSLVFVGAVFDFVERGERRSLLLAAGALAVALTAGPGTYTMLLLLLVFGAGAWLRYRGTDSAEWNRVAAAVRSIMSQRDDVIQVGAVFVATLVIAATGFLLNFGGLQAALNLFVAWLRSFSLASEYPFWYYAGVLVLYEPAIFLFGLLGAVIAVQRRQAFDLFLVTWFLGSFGLYTLIGATEPSLVVPMLAPLALLAGRGVAAVLNFGETDEALRGLLVVAFVIPLVVYAGVQLTFYAEMTAQSVTLFLALGAAVLAVVIAVVFVSSRFGMGWRPATVGRGAGVSMLLLSLGVTLHMGWHLNYLAHEPVRELLLLEPASADVREMVAALETLSLDRVGDTVNMPITVDGRLTPIVRWYLSEFENVTVTDVVRSPDTPVVIMPASDKMPPLGDRYIGQGFRVSSRWRLAELTGADFVRWYFYREGPAAVPYSELIMFVGR